MKLAMKIACAAALSFSAAAFAGATNQPPFVVIPINPFTNASPRFFISTNLFDARSNLQRLRNQQPPLPGVYQTKPYAGVVVVPEPQHDDRCIVGRRVPEISGISSNMPAIKPPQKFIPFTPAKK